MNIKQSPYYFSGIMPDNPDARQFGLFEPITRRFVLVSHSPAHLRKISTLFSSRYSLILCRLDTAVEFSSLLIDNSCCTKWTCPSPDIGGVGDEMIIGFGGIFKVMNLTEIGDLATDEAIINDREYMLATYQWTSPPARYLAGMAIDVGKFTSMPMKDADDVAKFRAIGDIIYSEFDFALAEQQILEMINS